jgi:hypothetical protein
MAVNICAQYQDAKVLLGTILATNRILELVKLRSNKPLDESYTYWLVVSPLESEYDAK